MSEHDAIQLEQSDAAGTGNKPGEFVWYELLTPDSAASARFYAGLLGWNIRDDPEYREITASEGMVGGMLQLTPEMTAGGARPAWLGYLAVDDVDAIIARVEAAGGRTLLPPRDMKHVGRFALLSDPQGAAFYVIKPEGAAAETSNAFAADRPMQGHCAWNELASDDPPGAWRFYGDLFGWVKDGEMDMGPLGTYEMIRHGFMLGGIYPKVEADPNSHWLFYFRVEEIEAAQDYARANGATVLQEPTEIPGGDHAMILLDPQGAAVGVVGRRK